jgi:hypothetical protein
LNTWFWIAFVALALAKLVLVSHDEIVLYSADDQGFAYSAGGWYWGRPYSAYSHVRQPVYPLFVAASSALGLPLRISIELVWIGACAWTATALRRCGGRSLLVLAACGLILFHPWLFNLNCRMLADTLYTPLLLVFLTGSAAAMLERSWRAMLSWAGPAAIAGALAANTRQESILILGSIAVTAVVCLMLGLLKRADRPTTLRRTLVAAGLPLAATLALTHGFRAANYADIGVYSSYDLESPGYRALYKALLAIPPEKHDLRLPVPRDVREKAYAASPAFATLRHALEEDKRLHGYAEACERQTGAKGEYGAWTCWAIRQAVWVSREHKVGTARDVDDLFATAAAEIRAAMSEGRLEHRAVPVDFLPPEWGLLVRQVPASARVSWDMLVGPAVSRNRSEKLPAKQAALFEPTALRRIATAKIVDGDESTAGNDLWYSPGRSAELAGVKKAIGDAHPWIVRIQASLLPVALLLALVGVRRGWVQDRWYVLMTVLGAALAARVVLVVLLDATGIDAQRRYLLPASVLAIIVSLFTIQAIVATIASLRRRSPRPVVAAPRLEPVRG